MVSVVINEPQQLWALVEMEHLALLIMSVCLRHRRSPPGDALSPTPMHYSVVENKHHPFTAICKNSWNSSRRNYRLTIYQESWTAWNGNIYCGRIRRWDNLLCFEYVLWTYGQCRPVIYWLPEISALQSLRLKYFSSLNTYRFIIFPPSLKILSSGRNPQDVLVFNS